MVKKIVLRYPDGCFLSWNGEHWGKTHNVHYAADKGAFLYEKDANPDKAEGAELVEFEITYTATGRTSKDLYKDGIDIDTWNTRHPQPDDD